MRAFTPTRVRVNRQADRLKAAFLAEVGRRCWFCGSSASVHVHEIASGNGNRVRAMLQRFALAPACDDCNCGPLTDKGETGGAWPIRRQLAVKRLCDPAYLNRAHLRAFNRLRGHNEQFITLADLRPYLRRERYRLRKLGVLA